MTLDSGETIRLIISAAVELPTKLAHSNLIANIPYLMAGHKYVSDLYKPKLKFKGKCQYTMEFNKGHLVLKILPITANQPTTHQTIYLHDDTTYEPPTFVQPEHYHNINKANLQTPTAFLWHLRYACTSK
jgi:hypothetical protein